MSQLTGTEFQNEKGSQGNLLKWIWLKIYPFINAVLPDVASAISTALAGYATEQYVDDAIAQEVIDRDAAISTLETALQTAIDSKTTSAETATQIQTAIDNLVNGAPLALDTLKELADALALNQDGDDTTLNALNTLITTVDGKASQASVDALSTAVDGKADKTYVDDNFTTKTKTNQLKEYTATLFEEFFNKLSYVPTSKRLFASTTSVVAGMQKYVMYGAGSLSSYTFDVLAMINYSAGGIGLRYKIQTSDVTAWPSGVDADLDAILVKTVDGSGKTTSVSVFFNPNIYNENVQNFDIQVIHNIDYQVQPLPSIWQYGQLNNYTA